MKRLLDTGDSWVLAAQRALLGAVMLPHGAQKVFGWFGGYGLRGTMSYFTDVLHIPTALAFLVIMAESLGALALIAGLGTRVAAFGLSATMIGAIFLGHLPHGFFMNWFGAQAGEGFEYHLLALALSVPLTVAGGGLFSADRALAARLPAFAEAHRAPLPA